MPVVTAPGSALTDSGELLDWIVNELTTNYRFTTYQDNAGAGVVRAYILERPQVETFHNDAPMTLWLANSDSGTESDDSLATIAGSISMNMAAVTAASFLEDVASQSVTVDFVDDAGSQEIRVTAGDFSSWTTAGFSVGDLVVVSSAATAGNNGTYEIQNISTTSVAGDSLEILEIANGGPKDIAAFDTGDVISVVGQYKVEGINGRSDTSGFMNLPRNDDLWEPTSMSGTGPDFYPYTSAQLLISQDADLASPTEPLHFILILETSPGVYRQMSFGEVVKLVDWVGGHYFSGSYFNESQAIDANGFAWNQGAHNNVWDYTLSAANPGGLWQSDWVNVGDTQANTAGRGWLRFGAQGSVSLDAPTHYNAAIYPHHNGAGGYLIGFSPSAFSGQSEAYPLTVFGTYNTNSYTGTQPEHAPMAIVPGVFVADITNLDSGSVFQDPNTSEKFLVIPFYTKAGSDNGSTEKWGYLIRNPDLTV